jgi:hypothetical protein
MPHHQLDDEEFDAPNLTDGSALANNRVQVAPEVEALPDEDTVLAYTHHHRKGLVKTLTKQGIPEDRETQAMLLQTLKDMDVQALSRKKIKSDEKVGSQNAQQAKAIIAEILMRTPNSATVLDVTEVMAQPKQLTADVPAPVLVEGETATVAPHQTYDTFVAKFPRPGPDAK